VKSYELLLLALGLSMDAFAVAVSIGLTITGASVKKALISGLYFGGFQAGMPLIGYFAASLFAERIMAYGPWVAFGLLVFFGSKMVIEGLKKEKSDDDGSFSNDEHSLKPTKMLPLAFATSIDALAIGVSFTFLQVNIVSAVSLIGIVTLLVSFAGVKIGQLFGGKLKSKAQVVGGVVLVLIGLRILLEHLGVV